MAGNRKGLVARWLEGKERSEDYARSKLPTNRWTLFWDILKGRFGKLVIVNLLTFLTFLPAIAVFVFRSMMLTAQGAIGPFNSALGAGYPVRPDLAGVYEGMLLTNDLIFFALYIVAGAIAAVGISGGMYIIRNMLWTEGIFVANDFARGIKRNYLNVLEATLVFTAILFLSQTMKNLADYNIAMNPEGGAQNVWMTISKFMGYAFIIVGFFVSLWMVSLGINYKQGPWALFRNGSIMTFGTLIQTIFFAIIVLLPFLLVIFASGFFLVVGVMMLIFFSFSFSMLVWMDYSQWAFDNFVNPNLGVSTGRGLYNKESGKMGGGPIANETDNEALRQYRRMIVAQGRSKLVCRPIQPIDDDVELYQLPDSFSRDDLQRLKESKEKIEEGVKAYEEEHKNDEQYVEYNRQFDENERAIREEESGSKKKKKQQKHPPKMLNKR